MAGQAASGGKECRRLVLLCRLFIAASKPISSLSLSRLPPNGQAEPGRRQQGGALATDRLSFHHAQGRFGVNCLICPARRGRYRKLRLFSSSAKLFPTHTKGRSARCQPPAHPRLACAIPCVTDGTPFVPKRAERSATDPRLSTPATKRRMVCKRYGSTVRRA